MKNQYRGEDYLKRGTWAISWFKVGLGKKQGGAGGWHPNAHYGNIYGKNLKNTVKLVMGQLPFLKRLRM